MDIEEAFTAEAVERAGTNVTGELEAELRLMLQSVVNANEIAAFTEEHEDTAVLAFIAGRTYQTDQNRITIHMPPRLHERFLEFLEATIEEGSSP